jgi:hypothetical protein
MSFRLRLQGDRSLAAVATAVVERLGRECGLHEDEARVLGDSARCACERAGRDTDPSEMTSAARGARVRLAVTGGDAPGDVTVEARVQRDLP